MKMILKLIIALSLVSVSKELKAQNRFIKLNSVTLKQSNWADFQHAFPGVSMDENGRITATGAFDMFADIKAKAVLIGNKEYFEDLFGNQSPFGPGGLDHDSPPKPEDKAPKDEDPEEKNKYGRPTKVTVGSVTMTCKGCESCGFVTDEYSFGSSGACHGCYGKDEGKCGSGYRIEKNAVGSVVDSELRILSTF